jgi:hypothetical protein
MNKSKNLVVILTSIALLMVLFVSGCSSSSNKGDKFIMGGTYRLSENETIDGNLSIFGAAASLEKGSIVNGDVVLIGGTVNIDGTVNGGINGLGGSITLGDTAVVQGDVSTVGANVNKSDTAVVQGRVVEQSENGVQLPDVPRVIVPSILQPLGDAMGGLTRSLVIALLAVLVVLFVPRQTINVSKTIQDNPVSAGAIGLLTCILLPFVIVILAITLVLIPLSMAAILIFFLGLILGWIAIGYELGNRIAELFKSSWAPAVSAGIGTFTLSIVSGIFGAIPCVGWVIPTLILLIATGGVVISAFGTRLINKSGSGPTIQVINPTPSQPPVGNPPASSSNYESAVVDSQFAAEKEEVTPAMHDDADVSDVLADVEKKPKARSRKPKADSSSIEAKS